MKLILLLALAALSRAKTFLFITKSQDVAYKEILLVNGAPPADNISDVGKFIDNFRKVHCKFDLLAYSIYQENTVPVFCPPEVPLPYSKDSPGDIFVLLIINPFTHGCNENAGFTYSWKSSYLFLQECKALHGDDLKFNLATALHFNSRNLLAYPATKLIKKPSLPRFSFAFITRLTFARSVLLPFLENHLVSIEAGILDPDDIGTFELLKYLHSVKFIPVFCVKSEKQELNNLHLVIDRCKEFGIEITAFKVKSMKLEKKLKTFADIPNTFYIPNLADLYLGQDEKFRIAFVGTSVNTFQEIASATLSDERQFSAFALFNLPPDADKIRKITLIPAVDRGIHKNYSRDPYETVILLKELPHHDYLISDHFLCLTFSDFCKYFEVLQYKFILRIKAGFNSEFIEGMLDMPFVPRLLGLVMSDCKLESVEFLSNFLLKAESLEILDLSGNNLTISAVHSLIQITANMTHLNSLKVNIESNSISLSEFVHHCMYSFNPDLEMSYHLTFLINFFDSNHILLGLIEKIEKSFTKGLKWEIGMDADSIEFLAVNRELIDKFFSLLTITNAQSFLQLYQVKDPIEEGNHGSVYNAIRISDGTKVAIKRVHVYLDEVKLLRAFNEVEILDYLFMKNQENASLYSKNIVKFSKSFILDDHLLIELELLKTDLFKLINSHVYLDDKDVACYSRDILKGLELLHSIPAIHGDLKGKNILVSADNTVKLADFSLASKGEEFYGTAYCPYWRAPEVYKSGTVSTKV